MKVFVALAQENYYETQPMVLGVFSSKEYGEEYIKRKVEELYKLGWSEDAHVIQDIMPTRWGKEDKNESSYVFLPYEWTTNEDGQIRIREPLSNNSRFFNNPFDIWFESHEILGE